MMRFGYIVIFAGAVHLLWAAVLLFDPSAAWVTAIAFLGQLVSLEAEVAIYSGAAVLALATIAIRNPLWLWLSLLPQQCVLIFSAVGAAQAIYLSAFADGVIRPREFIAADQGPWIILCVLHVGAVWQEMKVWQKERWTG